MAQFTAEWDLVESVFFLDSFQGEGILRLKLPEGLGDGLALLRMQF